MIIPLYLLATGLQMWPRTCFPFIVARAHCFFTVSLLLVKTPGPFPQKMEGSLWQTQCKVYHLINTGIQCWCQWPHAKYIMWTLTMKSLIKGSLQYINIRQKEELFDGKAKTSSIKEGRFWTMNTNTIQSLHVSIFFLLKTGVLYKK